MTATPAAGTHAADPTVETVSVRVPADVRYGSVVRTLAASLGARCALTIDEIDDVRIAVDEAVALLVGVAATGSALDATFGVGEVALTVTVDVAARTGASLDRNGFGWAVLDALAELTDVRDAGPTLGLTMVKHAEEAILAGAVGSLDPDATVDTA